MGNRHKKNNKQTPPLLTTPPPSNNNNNTTTTTNNNNPQLTTNINHAIKIWDEQGKFGTDPSQGIRRLANLCTGDTVKILYNDDRVLRVALQAADPQELRENIRTMAIALLYNLATCKDHQIPMARNPDIIRVGVEGAMYVKPGTEDMRYFSLCLLCKLIREETGKELLCNNPLIIRAAIMATTNGTDKLRSMALDVLDSLATSNKENQVILCKNEEVMNTLIKLARNDNLEEKFVGWATFILKTLSTHEDNKLIMYSNPAIIDVGYHAASNRTGRFTPKVQYYGFSLLTSLALDTTIRVSMFQDHPEIIPVAVDVAINGKTDDIKNTALIYLMNLCINKENSYVMYQDQHLVNLALDAARAGNSTGFLFVGCFTYNHLNAVKMYDDSRFMNLALESIQSGTPNKNEKVIVGGLSLFQNFALVPSLRPRMLHDSTIMQLITNAMKLYLKTNPVLGKKVLTIIANLMIDHQNAEEIYFMDNYKEIIELVLDTATTTNNNNNNTVATKDANVEDDDDDEYDDNVKSMTLSVLTNMSTSERVAEDIALLSNITTMERSKVILSLMENNLDKSTHYVISFYTNLIKSSQRAAEKFDIDNKPLIKKLIPFLKSKDQYDILVVVMIMSNLVQVNMMEYSTILVEHVNEKILQDVMKVVKHVVTNDAETDLDGSYWDMSEPLQSLRGLCLVDSIRDKILSLPDFDVINILCQGVVEGMKRLDGKAVLYSTMALDSIVRNDNTRDIIKNKGNDIKIAMNMVVDFDNHQNKTEWNNVKDSGREVLKLLVLD
jgi:hypothetical protein